MTENSAAPAKRIPTGWIQAPMAHEGDDGVIISRLGGYWVWSFPGGLENVPNAREILDDGRAPDVPTRTSCHVIPAGREFKVDIMSNLWISGTADHILIQVIGDGELARCSLISGGKQRRNSVHSVRGRCECGEPIGAAYDLDTGEDPAAFVRELDQVVARHNERHGGSTCAACGTPVAKAWSALRADAGAYTVVEDGRQRLRRTIPRQDTPPVHVAASELRDDAAALVPVEKSEVGVAMVDGEPYAFRPACPHRGGPLGDATVKNGAVVCPWHRFTFDLKTGVCRENPRYKLWRYAAELCDGQIVVDASKYLTD
jgi:nitrite reductase/ring-hydroxylating ferredoxin subunit